MENQERIAKLVQNDWSTASVPKEFRRSNYGVVATLVGQIIALSGIYIGASMVGGMSLSEAFLATICGSAILAVLGGFLSWVGTKTGVGLSMLLRESFGTIGSYIISVMLLFVAVGFFGYQATFFGDTIHAMFPGAGWITSSTVAGVWGGLLMMTTALVGYKGIEWLSNWASPLILVMCIASCILAIVRIGSLSAFNDITLSYSGMTLSYLKGLLQGRNPASIRIATLLDKPSRRKVDLVADYVGFEVPDEFVVGYGLDYDEQYRNLPFVGVLKPHVYGG